MYLFMVTSSSSPIGTLFDVKGVYLADGPNLMEATRVFNRLFCDQLSKNDVPYSDISVDGDGKYAFRRLFYKVRLENNTVIEFEVSCASVSHKSLRRMTLGKIDDSMNCWDFGHLYHINADIQKCINDKSENVDDQTTTSFNVASFVNALDECLPDAIRKMILRSVILCGVRIVSRSV